MIGAQNERVKYNRTCTSRWWIWLDEKCLEGHKGRTRLGRKSLDRRCIADKLKTPYDDPTYGGGFGNCCDHLKDKDRNSDSRGSGGSNYREPKDHYSDKGR